jgi:hypothetical protein
MRVLLKSNPEGEGNDAVLQATTVDKHPLIGSRRWGVTTNEPGVITLWTESYDIGREKLIRDNLANPDSTSKELAKHDQFKPWNIYLKNLAETVSKSCVERIDVSPITFNRTTPGMAHKWRDDLR